ncbi:MAG: ATP synthase F1 subunit gamma [Alphaproteobacteria bacterium]|nr:ATP synthase F1 subunit gamma [Alphaproteobacteria bacterium]MDA8030307.1 ATP synthase F1 subunit gamma [Alphaproteobacteria bacterium]
MAGLKELRARIASVRSTQKITSAMKLVAGAKLRRAQEQAQAARPYAERMENLLAELAASTPSQPPLMSGSGKQNKHLLVVGTADRGLCGGFNANIVREARRDANKLIEEGREVAFYCLGRKGRDQLRMQHGDRIIAVVENLTRPQPSFSRAREIAADITRRFEAGEFDVCTMYFSKFLSALSQEPQALRLIPAANGQSPNDGDNETTADGGRHRQSPSNANIAGDNNGATADGGRQSPGHGDSQNAEKIGQGQGVAGTKGASAVSRGAPEFEPGQDEILAELLPHNLAVQIWRGILENNASEQGARMTAMDNATRNAGEMITRLTLVYNRSRQAAVTTELIEIVSAKEAM